MRIWSIHPKYLDPKGLVAVWRETLLAKNVLEGKTRGYINHPQLIRFKNTDNPIDAINEYLYHIYHHAISRKYKFDINKINKYFQSTTILVTSGQIEYEYNHILEKLKNRDIDYYEKIKNIELFQPHPMFEITLGVVENWEKVKDL